MGYNPRPSMVERYAHLLDTVKAAIDSDQEVRFPLPPKDISRERDRMHAILRSAELFTHAENGRYSDLRARTTVSVDWEAGCLVARPKGKSGRRLQAQAPNEFDALEALSGEGCQLHFKPSPGFTPERYDTLLREKHGYTIRALRDIPGDPDDPYFPSETVKAGDFQEREPKSEGWKSYLAVRIPSDKPTRRSGSGFGILDQLAPDS